MRDPNRYVYTNVRSHSLSCDLGENVIEVSFTPRFLRIVKTTTLTVRIDGILVLDAFEFDQSNRDGAAIFEFTFFVGDDFFVLTGSADADPEVSGYQPQYEVTRRFPFRGGDFVPFAGRDFEVLLPLIVEATRARAGKPPADDDVAYYEITCIPELGKFSVGTRTLRGAAVSPNVERAVEIADRYGLIDSRMLRAGHEEPIRCDLGAKLLEGTLEGPGPGSVTSASLTLSMNGQLWLDRLSFGIGSTAAITSVGRRRGFPTFGLSGWRHESDPWANIWSKTWVRRWKSIS